MTKITRLVRYKTGGVITFDNTSKHSQKLIEDLYYAYSSLYNCDKESQFNRTCHLIYDTKFDTIPIIDKKNVVDRLLEYLFLHNSNLIDTLSKNDNQDIYPWHNESDITNVLDLDDNIYNYSKIPELRTASHPDVIRFVEEIQPNELEILNIADDENIYAVPISPPPPDMHFFAGLNINRERYFVMSQNRQKKMLI